MDGISKENFLNNMAEADIDIQKFLKELTHKHGVHIAYQLFYTHTVLLRLSLKHGGGLSDDVIDVLKEACRRDLMLTHGKHFGIKSLDDFVP